MSQLIDPSIARQFDKLPPHDIDAEMCVLASMMLDKDVMGEVLTVIDREDIYQADHQVVFDVLTSMYESSREIDAVLVSAELGKRQLLEEIGGNAYLGEILGRVPSGAHGVHYARVVKEKAVLRRLISASNDILRDAYAPHTDAADVLEEAERRVFEISAVKQSQAVQHIGEVLAEVFEQIENKGHRGIETSFYDLDDMLNGLQKQEMYIVAGRPSMGKTSFALGILEHVAVSVHKPVLMFSLEMSKQQIIQRLLCMNAGVDSHKLRRGMLQSHEYAQLAGAVDALKDTPIYIDDSPTLTPLELRSKARRMKALHGVELIIIDYLQLMDASKSREGRQQQITEISRSIKATARELDVPVICLSQLNRQSESRDGHRPRMSDLRESGSIEQDADAVLLLHREDYYRMSEADFQPDNIGEVIIAKQRNGPTGTVKLCWVAKSTKYENLAMSTGLPF